MNEILSLPRVVEKLTNVANIDAAESEKFIKAFFSHLEDALAVSDRVEIDGLGAFERTDDFENPIKFIAAESLTKAVNQPFEMFEPIAVGDADLTADTDEDSTASILVEEPARVIPPAISPELQAQADQQSKTESEPFIEPIIPQPVQVEEPQPIDEPIVQEVVSEVETEPQQTAEEITAQPRRSHTATWVCIAFLLGIIVGAVATYYSRERLETIFGYEKAEAETESIQAAETGYDTIEEAVDVVVAEPEELPQVTIEEDSLALEIKPEVYDTVTPNHFLTTMARQYYGRMDYWVFIYEANAEQLGNPNKIRPGTRVLIPDRSEFETDDTTEETVARAKRMSREIYARYE